MEIKRNFPAKTTVPRPPSLESASVGLHVLAQQLVDARLVTRALALEPLHHIGIQADGHGLLARQMQLGLTKERLVQLGVFVCRY